MGKKGKRRNLAKMSEEQRARYLQQRADAEEEARHRKIQLIALYMKNKLKREDAFCRLNTAKINQNWRTILRELKVEEQRMEMNELEKFCKEAIERKDRKISRLLKDLDEAEDSYSMLQNGHMEIIQKLLETYQERADFFKKSHEDLKATMLQEFEEDAKEFKELSDQAQEQLECIACQLEDITEKQLKEDHERHLERVDDITATNSLRLEEITERYEAQLESLWQEIQDVLNGYIQRNEIFYADYMDLKERDDENTAIMLANCSEINRLSEQLENLKEKEAETREENELKVKQMTDMRNELAEKLAKRKLEVDQEMREDEERIKAISVESYQVIKTLEDLEKKGQSVLQLAAACSKYETDRDRAILFEISPTERATPEEPTEEPPEEIKEELPKSIWYKMENFWKRVNNVKVDVMCLQEEKASLKKENEALRMKLQDRLAELNIENGSNVHINDYLAKRPNSLQLDRIQPLDLEEKQKCRSACVGGARPKIDHAIRCVIPTATVTEANLTNAVRSKRLTQRRTRLPIITTIRNW